MWYVAMFQQMVQMSTLKHARANVRIRPRRADCFAPGAFSQELVIDLIPAQCKAVVAAHGPELAGRVRIGGSMHPAQQALQVV
mmetsp:Transcript_60087/g.145201  ORF Transcript_60087/g.145201 Transcript_60087/m.145201 type:complete len:83 (-) Transcript_60087:13-261(-)